MDRRFLLAATLALTVACSSATTPSTPTGTPTPSSTSPTDPGVDPPVDGPQKLAAYTEAEVQQLFDARCVRCHDARSATLDLSSPFTATTVSVRTGGETGKTACAGVSDFTTRIKPGDREASLLWHKVKGTQDCGKPMPYDAQGKKLDATELERLGLYIDGLAGK